MHSVPFVNLGFIIKPEKWDANLAHFSLSLIFSPSTGITCALLHILLKSELKKTLDRLKELKQIAWHPLLLPTILLELRTESIALDLMKVKLALYKVEKDNGTHKNYQDRQHHRKAGFTLRDLQSGNAKDSTLSLEFSRPLLPTVRSSMRNAK
jgi:hypothetical protein